MWNEQLECLKRAELERLQLDRLQELLERLHKCVPFYRKALSAAGVKPQDIRRLDDIKRLPFTTKSDLRDHYPLGLLAVPESDVQRIHASSGTRGKPTIAAYTSGDLQTWADLVARCLSAVGTKPGDIVQNAYGYGLFTGGLGLHYGAERLGSTVIPASTGRTQQQVMLLKDFKVRVLCCTPSYALSLAGTLDETRTQPDGLKLQIGLFGAEPWTEECRKQIEKTLRIKAYDIYGLSEVLGPGVAVECTAQSGLHVWEDHFFMEVIDPDTLEPVAHGVKGELVITTLTKEALPLLRYRTGDVCAIIEEPCSCGRSSRRITRLQGRLDDMLIIRGVNVYPSEIESVLFSAAELAPHYQIIIERAGALDQLTVRAELDPERQAQWKGTRSEEIERRNLAQRISNGLTERLGLTAIVDIINPLSLPRSEGKAMHVIDLRKAGTP